MATIDELINEYARSQVAQKQYGAAQRQDLAQGADKYRHQVLQQLAGQGVNIKPDVDLSSRYTATHGNQFAGSYDPKQDGRVAIGDKIKQLAQQQVGPYQFDSTFQAKTDPLTGARIMPKLDSLKYITDLNQQDRKEREDRRNKNIETALKVSEMYQKPINPMDSMQNVWAQVDGLTPIRVRELDQQKSYQDSQIGLERERNALQRSNQDFDNSMDIWDHSGVAPDGITGIDPGTPIYEKGGGGQKITYDDIKKEVLEYAKINRENPQAKAGLAEVIKTKILPAASEIMASGLDVGRVIDDVVNVYSNGQFSTIKEWYQWMEDNGVDVEEFKKQNGLSNFSVAQKGGEAAKMKPGVNPSLDDLAINRYGLTKTSGYRSPQDTERLKREGKPSFSGDPHEKGIASDYSLPRGTPGMTQKLAKFAADMKAQGYKVLHESIGKSNEHVHVDWGSKVQNLTYKPGQGDQKQNLLYNPQSQNQYSLYSRSMKPLETKVLTNVTIAAAKITGVDKTWLPGLMKLAHIESTNKPGNVNKKAVNNGKNGKEHATGLMQTLPSTFNQYKVKGYDDIYNPLDNMVAAIRYIKANYGHVNTALQKHGGKGY